jgi:RNA polymerase sigma-70 factor (ECF subfamily)
MKVLARIGDLREGEKLGAWVLGFCRNDLREWYRGKTTAEALDERHLQIIAKVNIEEELLRKEAVAALDQLLDDMSDTREAKIVRTLLDGVDRDEVCRRFGLSNENFRVILHRALEKFRGLLGPKNKR